MAYKSMAEISSCEGKLSLIQKVEMFSKLQEKKKN